MLARSRQLQSIFGLLKPFLYVQIWCQSVIVFQNHGVHAISRKHSIFPIIIFDSYPSREKRNCLAFKSIGSSGIEAFWLSAAHFRLPPPAAAVTANGIENSSSSPSLLPPSIVRAHCDLNGCLDRSEGNKMFARLLTPTDRRTRLTYSKASAAQVGLENGFGQCDRTAAGGAGGGEGEAEGLPRGHAWTGAEVGGSRQGWKHLMMVRVGSSYRDTFMIKIKTATLRTMPLNGWPSSRR